MYIWMTSMSGVRFSERPFDKGDIRSAMHCRPRPVAASGVFVPPKKVRTRIIYSDDRLGSSSSDFIYRSVERQK